MDKPSIDFTVYSDSDLDGSLLTINRFDYEANYQACLAEVTRRKDEGMWTITESPTSTIELETILDVAEVVIEAIQKIDIDLD